MSQRGEPSKQWVLAGLCLISVMLVALRDDYARQVSGLLRPVLAPLSQFSQRLAVHVNTRMQELHANPQPKLDESTLSLIQAMNQTIRSQEEKITRLRYWKSELGNFDCQLIDARVVARESLPLRDRVLINAGSDKGVTAGKGDLPASVATTRRLTHQKFVDLPEKLLVLGRNYMVGQVIDCSGYSATLQLVTDAGAPGGRAGFKMPCKLWRVVEPGKRRTILVPGPRGAIEKRPYAHDGKYPGPMPVGGGIEVRAEGNGAEVVLRDVPRDHDIQPGDVLTTSTSTQLLLPFGLTIGRVRAAEGQKNNAHFVTVYVTPLADLDNLDEVYVVLPVAKERS